MDERKEGENQSEDLSSWMVMRFNKSFGDYFEEIGKENNLKTVEAIKDAADIGMSVLKISKKTGRVPTSEEMEIILKASKISPFKENGKTPETQT